MAVKPVLVTGGAGFIGSNLVDTLLSDGERVVVVDNLSRPGSVRNAEWLSRRHGERVAIERVDVGDEPTMRRLVGGSRAVYHMAAQVAVTTSIVDPVLDFETNLQGTFNILEAARRSEPPPPVLFTSTNKVYGGLDDIPVELDGERYVLTGTPAGVGEDRPLDFHSPYGCSKGAADQYVRDYGRVFGVPAVVLRMSCVYGRRQWGTEDQGWVAHFGRALLKNAPITIYGDGFQVRDILWVDDLVAAMRCAVAAAVGATPRIYNIGGGPDNAVSVREVVDRLAALIGVNPKLVLNDWRPGDQRVYVTDTRRINEELGWRPSVAVEEGLVRLLEWLREAEGTKAMRPSPRIGTGRGRGSRAAAGASS